MCREFLEHIRHCHIKGCLSAGRENTLLRRSPGSSREEVENFGRQEYMAEGQINTGCDVIEDAIEAECTEVDERLSYTYSGESEDLIRLLPLPFAREDASNRLSRLHHVLDGVEYGRYIMFNESSSRTTGDSHEPDMIAGESSGV
ncbi:hypothetical protein E3Q10_00046 [Wallemia mellicola]|uniref:Uncharacterized protein n=1 Tax=Wallemia mellicola TaxID=1708541 RepID=A0A4T0NDJ8_9BASI|nr:hypothetical protein E3Q20_02612 [Wallemia mellicola]TIB94855.1 hypothetical protein E3Q19_00221 [Wallemia mellicola]TIC34531.1 hypothetical protein E3Q10_00046 [Wallemia mellicola]TIC34895.1 hypothetical protein E3Q09_02731 [Wallemia mellicola]TIC54663.1 hypothetical protein E3Q04_02324 [Wallemia mellicola]